MSGLWPSVLTVRHPSGLTVVLRGLRGRDRGEWEALREANRTWLAPWEASSPGQAESLNFRQLVRHFDREAGQGRLQPFVIEHDGRLVGQMHLFNIVWGPGRSGAVGYWVAQDRARLGIATLALAAVVDHAFAGLGLHRVEANIRPDNTASRRLVEKLGFRNEGVRERFLHMHDGWCDHVSYALTTEDVAGTSLVARINEGWRAGHV